MLLHRTARTVGNLRFVSKSCDSQRFRPLRADSSRRFQRSSPRNDTTRSVRLRYETGVPFEVPCSDPFLPGPQALTSVSVSNANGTAPAERRLRLANGSSTTSRGSAFAATWCQTDSKCASTRSSNEHQPNVSWTSTERQQSINGTSTRPQPNVNEASTEQQRVINPTIDFRREGTYRV